MELLLAHGIGTRTDLPIPRPLALYGAGFAVLISFAVLLLLWERPKLGDDRSGRPAPQVLQRMVDAGPLRVALQSVALVLAALVLAVALLGPRASDQLPLVVTMVVYTVFGLGLLFGF